MAVNFPEWKVPLTFCNIVLCAQCLPCGTEYEISINSTSTGGRLGKFDKVADFGL